MRSIEHNESHNAEHGSNTAWDELDTVPFAGEGKESLQESRFDSQRLPLSKNPEIRNAQEKFLRGEPLSVFDKIHDRDGASIVTRIGDYELKTDHAYRVVSESLYKQYASDGKITRNVDEYVEGKNNGGVDWYLGGAAAATKKYGGKQERIVVLECPAEKDYFTMTSDNGTRMVLNPRIRHIKSSSKAHPIPMSMITNVFHIDHSAGDN